MAQPIRLDTDQSLFYKISHLNWGLVFLITVLAGIGFLCLYASAGGSFSPWASKQMVRFGIGFCGMIVIALIHIRWWYSLAWILYGIALLLLIAVEIKGHIGMGAQRWINLGFMQLQPSEIMKIVVVMALARYFHKATIEDMRRVTFLIVPVLLILAPVALVLLQPNLGTAIMILLCGAGMIFMAGAPLWLFILGGIGGAASVPVVWNFMHEYQKKRVITFLNPESDPLGAGYNIIQSKIALGSGGWEGKGFLNGTQSRLNFLPEKQTDFIFTVWVEEWGFVGGIFLLTLLGLIFVYGILIALRCRHNFGRYLAIGLVINFSLYVFINISMVMGLIPVVGAPLPLVSYGGTSMISVMIGFGLMMSASLYRDSKVTNRFF
jgi:rod shape determining protein RodA